MPNILSHPDPKQIRNDKPSPMVFPAQAGVAGEIKRSCPCIVNGKWRNGNFVAGGTVISVPYRLIDMFHINILYINRPNVSLPVTE